MSKVLCESINCPIRADEQLLEVANAMLTEVLGICAVSTMFSEATSELAEPECKGLGPTITVNNVTHLFPQLRRFMGKPPATVSYKYTCRGLDN